MYSWWFLARFRKSETVKRFLLFLFFTFFSSLSVVFHAREMSSNEESEFLVNVSIIFKNHTIGVWNRICPKNSEIDKLDFSRTKMQMNYAKLTVSRSGFTKSFLMREFISEIFVEKLLRTRKIVETAMAFHLLYLQRRSTCPDCSDMSSYIGQNVSQEMGLYDINYKSP